MYNVYINTFHVLKFLTFVTFFSLGAFCQASENSPTSESAVQKSRLPSQSSLRGNKENFATRKQTKVSLGKSKRDPLQSVNMNQRQQVKNGQSRKPQAKKKQSLQPQLPNLEVRELPECVKILEPVIEDVRKVNASFGEDIGDKNPAFYTNQLKRQASLQKVIQSLYPENSPLLNTVELDVLKTFTWFVNYILATPKLLPLFEPKAIEELENYEVRFKKIIKSSALKKIETQYNNTNHFTLLRKNFHASQIFQMFQQGSYQTAMQDELMGPMNLLQQCYLLAKRQGLLSGFFRESGFGGGCAAQMCCNFQLWIMKNSNANSLDLELTLKNMKASETEVDYEKKLRTGAANSLNDVVYTLIGLSQKTPNLHESFDAIVTNPDEDRIEDFCTQLSDVAMSLSYQQKIRIGERLVIVSYDPQEAEDKEFVLVADLKKLIASSLGDIL